MRSSRTAATDPGHHTRPAEPASPPHGDATKPPGRLWLLKWGLVLLLLLILLLVMLPRLASHEARGGAPAKAPRPPASSTSSAPGSARAIISVASASTPARARLARP